MASQEDVDALPGTVAMDALAVLESERRGASVQLTDRYFRHQEAALRTVDGPEFVENRLGIVRESREVWDDIRVDFDSLTAENLRTASTRLRNVLERLPEVGHLERQYPGTCYVVPEWMRVDGEVRYGARVYFFGDDPPEREAIIARNVEATVGGERGDFDAYQGRLHGYPDCCIEFFQNADRFDGEKPPEVRSLDALDDRIDEAVVREGDLASTHVDELLPEFFESPHCYAFFAHEFYPEPGCETARKRGVRIYETLTDHLPEPLVRDYFRVNFGWSFLKAGPATESDIFGREHLQSYLPLRLLSSLSRYR